MILQELYVRQKDGCILDSDDDKEKVVKCLEAAILRRVSEVCFVTDLDVLFVL